MMKSLLLLIALSTFIYLIIFNKRLEKKILKLEDQARMGQADAMWALGDIASSKAFSEVAFDWYLQAAEHDTLQRIVTRVKLQESKGLIDQAECYLKAAVEMDLTGAKIALASFYRRYEIYPAESLRLLESAALEGDRRSLLAVVKLLNTLCQEALPEELELMQRKIRHFLELAKFQRHQV